MSQTAAQWARAQIEAGEPEDKIVTVYIDGIPITRPLWDMAGHADVSDFLRRAEGGWIPSKTESIKISDGYSYVSQELYDKFGLEFLRKLNGGGHVEVVPQP